MSISGERTETGLVVSVNSLLWASAIRALCHAGGLSSPAGIVHDSSLTVVAELSQSGRWWLVRVRALPSRMFRGHVWGSILLAFHDVMENPTLIITGSL